MRRYGLILLMVVGLALGASTASARPYVLEFSIDIGSDCELSDPSADGDEAFDPGDVYWNDGSQVLPPGQNGQKDDGRLFGMDPAPDPINGSIVPVGGGTTEPYADFFDLDGHDQLDFSLLDLLPPWGGGTIPERPSTAVFAPVFLAVSFDDDADAGWPALDVPVTKPSMAGSIFGTSAGKDEVVEVGLIPVGWNLYGVSSLNPLATEIKVHPNWAPNPDTGDVDDDDVDSLDLVETPDLAPVWLFSADHEATFMLDPGDVYEDVGGVPMMVVDDVAHLGLPDDVDIDAFEFVWMAPDDQGARVLTLLFSVDQDDPLTAYVDESGGLDPKMIYYSHLNGVSFPLLPEPLAEDVDAIANWDEPLNPEEPDLDWGDAPDSTTAPQYSTLAVNNGANHMIVAGMYLGASIDGEWDGQPDATATGDDNDGNDDEDGVALASVLTPGATATVTVTASQAGILQGWIDFNANATWADPGEQIFVDVPLVAGPNTFSFPVPASAMCGQAVARFRYSTQRGLGFAGAAPDGEVEDYVLTIQEPEPDYDWGDAPDQPYPTFAANNGSRHKIVPGMMMGASIDAESDGQPHISALGDDINDGNDDEDGVIFTSPLYPGGSSKVTVTVTQPGLLQAWIDFNNNGTWTEAGEQIFVDQPLNVGSNSLGFPVPTWAQPGVAFCRFRYSTQAGLSFIGAAPDGEVEDYEHYVQEDPNQYDYGDAPSQFAAGGYPTMLAANGARHVLGGGLWMGQVADAESDGQPTVNADGDDVNGFPDEDGVVFLTTMVYGRQAKVDVHASAPGLVDAWIDYNVDGDWTDAGEQVFTSVTVNPGVNTLTFTLPAAPAGAVRASYARFRISSTGGLTPGGTATDGEVEDYVVRLQSVGSIVGVQIWDLNADGMRQAGEPTQSGWTVYVDLNNNGQLDAGEPSALTGSTGAYTLGNLAPGTYAVREVGGPLWRLTSPAGGHIVTVPSGGVAGGADFLTWMLGDEDFDKDVDAADIDLVGQAVGCGLTGRVYDLNDDGAVDVLDLDEIVLNLVFIGGSSAVRGTHYGDADLNGNVNIQDFVILKNNFGTGSTWSQADFDLNGAVDIQDFVILKNNFGS